jgi:RecB family exonuclease
MPFSTAAAYPDPGWNAANHVASVSISDHVPDPVPAVLESEIIAGGAATIQRQFIEPFGAFVSGRLGVRGLWPMQAGLAANVRGGLIHKALHRLYSDCPSREQIRQWNEAEIEARTDKAVLASFQRHEQHADSMLQQLLRLEKVRVKRLLRGVIEVDCGRDEFCISSVEQDFELRLAGLAMRLRVDRIDSVHNIDSNRDRGKEHIILDYKTGMPKRLLDRDKNPKDMQLVVYAYAVGDSVCGIGLFNIDSRDIALDAACRDLSPKLDWDSSLADWKHQVEIAAGDIAAGDVRLSVLQNAQQARPLSLLSRYRELLHDS